MCIFHRGLHSVNNTTHNHKIWTSKISRPCLENNKSIESLLGHKHSRVSLVGESIHTTAADHITAFESSSIIASEANEDELAISTDRFSTGTPVGYQSNRLQSGKLVVAVDIDEVLGSFLLALNTFIAERYSLNCTVAEYHIYNFDKVWKCSLSEASTRVHEFFKSGHFRKGIQPIPGAYQTLIQLAPLCHFSVVTSRQNIIREHTIEWIERHYPGLFREIHFGNHFAIDGVARSKSEICKSFGAQILIDDNPRYALDCAENGIEVLLFDYQNGYPWCKTDDISLHPLIKKVHCWQEVQQHLAARVLS
ncbi:hypothetical protein SUGI_0112490 [Cryptomeria japonica]|nr:hypothetical protein SUGI_0112490 [Cryptomeria japonica]